VLGDQHLVDAVALVDDQRLDDLVRAVLCGPVLLTYQDDGAPHVSVFPVAL